MDGGEVEDPLIAVELIDPLRFWSESIAEAGLTTHSRNHRCYKVAAKQHKCVETQVEPTLVRVKLAEGLIR